jgi:RimJ/RimL family protein N-acetyltransferase
LFDAYPMLHSIWTPTLSALADAHTKSWETYGGTGEVLLAYRGDDLVGLTGWWKISESELGLRWHGVLPEFRNQGVSKSILALLLPRLPSHAKFLYEVTKNTQSCASFQRCGFDMVSDATLVRRVLEDAHYDLGGGGWVLGLNLQSSN